MGVSSGSQVSNGSRQTQVSNGIPTLVLQIAPSGFQVGVWIEVSRGSGRFQMGMG